MAWDIDLVFLFSICMSPASCLTKFTLWSVISLLSGSYILVPHFQYFQPGPLADLPSLHHISIFHTWLGAGWKASFSIVFSWFWGSPLNFTVATSGFTKVPVNSLELCWLYRSFWGEKQLSYRHLWTYLMIFLGLTLSLLIKF